MCCVGNVHFCNRTANSTLSPLHSRRSYFYQYNFKKFKGRLIYIYIHICIHAIHAFNNIHIHAVIPSEGWSKLHFENHDTEQLFLSNNGRGICLFLFFFVGVRL